MAFCAAHSNANQRFCDVCKFSVHINTLHEVSWNCTFFTNLATWRLWHATQDHFLTCWCWPISWIKTNTILLNMPEHANTQWDSHFTGPSLPLSLSIYLSHSLCEDGEFHHADVTSTTTTHSDNFICCMSKDNITDGVMWPDVHLTRYGAVTEKRKWTKYF